MSKQVKILRTPTIPDDAVKREAVLGKLLAAIHTKRGELARNLKAIGKKPLAKSSKATRDALDKKVATWVRSLGQLKKDASKGVLHTRQSAVLGTVEEINAMVLEYEDLRTGAVKALEAEVAERWERFGDGLTRRTSRDTVLQKVVLAFHQARGKKLGSSPWKTIDTAREDVKTYYAGRKEIADIRQDVYGAKIGLDAKERREILDACISDDRVDLKGCLAKLEAALKKRWASVPRERVAKWTGMPAAGRSAWVYDGGSHDGHSIHVTCYGDAWKVVSVREGDSADDLFDGMFVSSISAGARMHATWEKTGRKDDSSNPKMYLGGGLGGRRDWLDDASKKALTEALAGSRRAVASILQRNVVKRFADERSALAGLG